MWLYVWTSELKEAYLWAWPSIPTTNLLAYYPLTSDANDHKADLWATWTTYNWTWTWTASYSTVWGKTAAYFVRGSRRISTWLSRSSLPITFGCRVYHTTSNDWETPIWNPTWNNSNWFAIRLVYTSGSEVMYVTNWSGSDQNILTWFESNTRIHLMVTIESWTTKVYMNGELIKTISSGSAGGSTFYLASYWSYTTYWFNGYIRDVLIYSKVLSDGEVSDIYNATK